MALLSPSTSGVHRRAEHRRPGGFWGPQRRGLGGEGMHGASLESRYRACPAPPAGRSGMPACPLTAQCSDSQEPQATADSLSARAQGPLHAEQRPLLHSRAGRSLTPAALPLLRRTPSSAAPARCPARPLPDRPPSTPRSASTACSVSGPSPSGSCPSRPSGGLALNG